MDTTIYYTTDAGEKNNIQKMKINRDTDEDAIKSQKPVKQATINLLSKRAACLQSCITKVTAGTVREAKFGASQARRVIVKALGAKGYNGESALLDAIEESAAYEAEIELR